MGKLTPMMQQYKRIKSQYPDAILFFRLGDFYEMFNDDAKIAARILDLALTSRNKGGGDKVPMAGVPYHSAETYIAKLIENGYKVAICEQLEDPSETKGIVERDVVRVITPGTIIEEEMLTDKENNYLAAVRLFNNRIGLSYIDISTGEFMLTEIDTDKTDKIWDEIDRIRPSEIIIDSSYENSNKFNNLSKDLGFLYSSSKINNKKKAYEYLIGHFQTQSLNGFGCEEMEAGIIAAAEIIKYLKDTQKRSLKHVTKITTYYLDQYMIVDSMTRKNLELTSTIRENKRKGTLLDILDRTITSMGGRLIKNWINQPLIKKNKIEQRLDAIEELCNNYLLLEKIRLNLDGIYDLERILSKVTYGTANARDLASLKYSLLKLPDLKNNVGKLKSSLFKNLYDSFDPLKELADLLETGIVDEPPVSVREGGIIKEGYNSTLDQLRKSRQKGKEWIANLQKSEIERTGINSLKVGFNKVFGYYIEVTKANLDKVPNNYTRKQTLSNSERYITPELKEKEAQVLGAEEKINDLEYKIFVDIREEVGKNLKKIQQTGQIIAFIDVITSLSLITLEKNLNRPVINNDGVIEIKSGRHLVVEDMLDGVFVPNDTYLNREEERFIIITGPNMSGKSTYMRQVALIVLMAQMGCFVPAEEARIGIVDRIFTRVGASDDLTTGQSTFMVEMNEVANIVNNATKDSLIILDEVGRGTSTYDGLSIAWAVSEYINDKDKIGARTLFATHYHELTSLEEEMEGIKNYNVLVEEDEQGVHFLHKIIKGRANDSYGIEVAKLAGLPEEIILKAEEILTELENKDSRKENQKSNMPIDISQNMKKRQMALFQTEDPIVKKIREKEIINMTPIEAINFLYELQQEAKRKYENYG